jgi:hypothetical protein
MLICPHTKFHLPVSLGMPVKQKTEHIFRTAAMSLLQKKNPSTENVFFSSVVGYFNFKILKLALMKRCWCRSNVGSSHDRHFGTIYGRT